MKKKKVYCKNCNKYFNTLCYYGSDGKKHRDYITGKLIRNQNNKYVLCNENKKGECKYFDPLQVKEK